MVFCRKNSGAISTMPPMVTTMKLKISSSVTFFSRILCLVTIDMVPAPYSAATAAAGEVFFSSPRVAVM